MRLKENLEGVRFGRIVVLKCVGKTRNNITVYKCVCDCGDEKYLRSDKIKTQQVGACGCAKNKIRPCYRRNRKPGTRIKRTSEYRAWEDIKKRCLNPKHKDYPNYGGRGIGMCDEWVNSSASFLKDMGNKPSSLHEIDRIDNELGYTKDNCHWVTKKVNNWNKRNNRVFMYKGRDVCVAELSERYKIKYSVLYYRLCALMMPVEEALIV